jgi:hypothetical protein
LPAYLTALLITVCLEVAVVAAMAHWWRSLTLMPLVTACVALNLLTHPSANLLRMVFATPIFPLEVAVVLVEAVGYRVICQLPISKSFTISVLANSLSMLVGVIAFWRP